MALSVWTAAEGRRSWLIALVACYVFVGTFFPIVSELDSVPLNIAQSYLYFAALGLLVMLRRLASRPVPSRTSVP
jgi:hypothetical protein